MNSKINKYRGTKVSMTDALKELGWVVWPPKNEGEECECGCLIKDGRLHMCSEHQPKPAI